MQEHEAHVARTSAGFDHVNTLDTKLEVRRIFYAQGLEFHNDQMPSSIRVPQVLLDPASGHGSMTSKQGLAIVVHSDDEFEYGNQEQGVRYVVTRVTTRTAFKSALETPNAHVVYAGHARFGRGPCFGRGTKTDKGEHWEDGTDPSNGIFRMAFPFLSVPVSEVLEHGYTANLVASSVSISAADSDPDLRAHLGAKRPLTAAQIHPELPARAKDKDPTRTFWAYRAFNDQTLQEHVVLHANWQDTTTDPLDLGATDLKLRVFCHFGCTTLRHNQPVLRDLKAWKREGDNRHAYFTSNLSFGPETVFYLYHLLSYNKYNRGAEWKPSLDYAVSKTNNDLAASGFSYKLV